MLVYNHLYGNNTLGMIYGRTTPASSSDKPSILFDGFRNTGI